jgi:hypothetical protein
MKRKNLGKGFGKGYLNILNTDPAIHSMSAKGIKQKKMMNPVPKKSKMPSISQIKDMEFVIDYPTDSFGGSNTGDAELYYDEKNDVFYEVDVPVEVLAEEGSKTKISKIDDLERIEELKEQYGFETKWERKVHDDIADSREIKREKFKKDFVKAGFNLKDKTSFWGQKMTFEEAIDNMDISDIKEGYKMIRQEEEFNRMVKDNPKKWELVKDKSGKTIGVKPR